jgi:hypothetical protein
MLGSAWEVDERKGVKITQTIKSRKGGKPCFMATVHFTYVWSHTYQPKVDDAWHVGEIRQRNDFLDISL